MTQILKRLRRRSGKNREKMKAYLSKSFQREAKSDGVSDEGFEEAIRRAEKGLIDAKLGGHLIQAKNS